MKRSFINVEIKSMTAGAVRKKKEEKWELQDKESEFV